MKPDPERAAQLRAHFQDGFRGIAKRLWPHLHLVLAVDSGSNQIYGEMLRENYCRGVSFYSPFYAATEGRSLRLETAVLLNVLVAKRTMHHHTSKRPTPLFAMLSVSSKSCRLKSM